MSRVITIMLCFFGVVVCAFFIFVGVRMQSEKQDELAELPAISCADLIDSNRESLDRLAMVQFRPGKHIVPFDENEDGIWEKVVVPFFPASTKKLGHNYRAVIVDFTDVPDAATLQRRIESQKIVAEYWYYSQQLDREAYNRLSEKYTSLDFNRSVFLYAGYPPSNLSLAGVFIYGGSGIAILFLLVLGWQIFRLILIGIQHSESALAEESDAVTEESKVVNRAGLPRKSDLAINEQAWR